MSDPLTDIESAKAYLDMGRMGVLVFRGAMEESDNDLSVAVAVTAAYFTGVMRGSRDA